MRCLDILKVVTLQHNGDKQHSGHMVPSHSRSAAIVALGTVFSPFSPAL